MQFPRLTVFAAALLFCWPLMRAQDVNQNANQEANPSQAQNWGLSPMDALADHASFHTDFTFDKTMLKAFSQTVPEEDRPIVAKLNSVTVHTFRYSAPGMYNPAALAAVRAQYNSNGWQHVVSQQKNAHPTEPDGGPAANSDTRPLNPTKTDVWVRMDHANVDGAVVLVANEKNINLVVVDGVLSPLDLLHLRGHLGIPQFDGGSLGTQP